MGEWLMFAAPVAILVLAFAALIYLMHTRNALPDPDLANGRRPLRPERFHPMERLLSRADFDFLAAQPGYHPRIGRRLRAGRRRIFRSYLRSMRREFLTLHATARQAAALSREDRPDLMAVLAKQRVIFSLAMVAVHVRLSLDGLGLGRPDVSGLLQAYRSSDKVLREMSAAAVRA